MPRREASLSESYERIGKILILGEFNYALSSLIVGLSTATTYEQWGRVVLDNLEVWELYPSRAFQEEKLELSS